MILQELQDRKLIHPPKWLITNTIYLTIMGSQAYGVTTESSDHDLYGVVIPPKDDVFPHLRGEILDFGRQKQRFSQYQEHHIIDPDAAGGKGREYDITVSSIVKYCHLLMENNPNVIDSIFTPNNCVVHITSIGQILRDNRHKFLHKGAFFKFKGYAYSQQTKMTGKPVGKRIELYEKWGYDVKYAMHLVRLLSECEQILIEEDLDLQRNREQLKSIRRGEWTVDQIREYFTQKETQLEQAYHESKLPNKPDEEVIKNILCQCLETHYGSLDKCVAQLDKYEVMVRAIKEIIKEVS